jgi:glycosyltransferase involved in cell wall biosynthesis
MISVIIPTRNRVHMISSLLVSFGNQALDPECYEVIIVDNGSTDSTVSILKSLQALRTNTKVIIEPRPGLHYARHKGLLEASGSIVTYADDDIEPIPTWLAAINECFSDSKVSLLGGNNIPLFMGMPPDWLCLLWNGRNFDHAKAVSMLSIQEHPPGRYDFDPYMVWGCNFSIRKDVLLAAGGFHPDGMPQNLIRFRGDGETHVSKYVSENKLKCIFDSRATVYHKVTPERMTLGYFHKRGFNQGVSDSYTHLRNPPESSSSNQSCNPRELASAIKIKLRATKSKFFERFSLAEPTPNPGRTAFQEGYDEGFAYHQAVYTKDPEVRAWVHKENYLQ